MATQQISFDDKELGQSSSFAENKKLTFQNVNEIKSVVNNNANEQIEEAPIDGMQYARIDSGWQILASSSPNIGTVGQIPFANVAEDNFDNSDDLSFISGAFSVGSNFKVGSDVGTKMWSDLDPDNNIPSPEGGTIAYNENTGEMRSYQNGSWRKLGGVLSGSGTTLGFDQQSVDLGGEYTDNILLTGVGGGTNGRTFQINGNGQILFKAELENDATQQSVMIANGNSLSIACQDNTAFDETEATVILGKTVMFLRSKSTSGQTQMTLDDGSGLTFDDPSGVGILYTSDMFATASLNDRWLPDYAAVKRGQLRDVTVATLPTNVAGEMVYVSDESGGAVVAFSDGTNWRRVTDRAIVS